MYLVKYENRFLFYQSVRTGSTVTDACRPAGGVSPVYHVTMSQETVVPDASMAGWESPATKVQYDL